YVVFCGANPRSFFGTKVGEYERFAQPFVGNQPNTNFFTFDVPADGIYPFKIIYWQTGRGANLQFFSVDTTSGSFLLINDPNAPFDAVASYKSLNQPKSNGPFVAEVSPLPDAAGISPSDPVQVLLVDGTNALNDSSVKLFLNNTQVTPQTMNRTGSKLLVKYSPNASRTTLNNLMRIEFAATTGFKATNSWSFTINPSGAPRTIATGQWDFDFGDLRATIGQPLQYLDGAGGQTVTKTQFGSTRDFGISDINGQPALVMRVPGDLDRNIGYIM